MFNECICSSTRAYAIIFIFMCRQQDIFNDYKDFLKNLTKTGSSKLFTNGGKEYASILMSVLLDNTNSVARIFSYGFRPDLVTTDEYKQALERFLKSSYKELRVMVETDEAVDKEPIKMLKKAYQEGNDHVTLRLITPEDRKELINQLGGGHRNFAVFDNDKYRMEYDPDDFKAFGSFNDVETCTRLTTLFDKAFEKATSLMEETVTV